MNSISTDGLPGPAGRTGKLDLKSRKPDRADDGRHGPRLVTHTLRFSIGGEDLFRPRAISVGILA